MNDPWTPTAIIAKHPTLGYRCATGYHHPDGGLWPEEWSWRPTRRWAIRRARRYARNQRRFESSVWVVVDE